MIRNIQISSENIYNHPMHCNRPTGVRLVVHINWALSFAHDHVFDFEFTDRINPCRKKAYAGLDALRDKVNSADLDINHFRKSPHWEMV